MTKHIFPLSYQPKIEKVYSGKIEQSLRFAKPKMLPKYNAGDELLLFHWKGRPYWSEWLHPVIVPCIAVDPIILFSAGLKFEKQLAFAGKQPHVPKIKVNRLYTWEELDWLALIDGIDPPTGECLGSVLLGKNTSKFGRIEFGVGHRGQIVHWDWRKRVNYKIKPKKEK